MRMHLRHLLLAVCTLCAFSADVWAAKKQDVSKLSALDRYIEEASGRASGPDAGTASAGSIWSSDGLYTDMARDLRASRLDDIVTILVAERATAVVTGSTQSARSSNVDNSIGALAGLTRVPGPWSALASLSGDSQLDGQGSTSRETVLSTTLTARVTQVLPNGYLVIQGNKQVQLNSERQTVTVRGVIRPSDLSSGNVVASDRVAQLEINIDGKGVVGDAIRRPFILFRILKGLLPF